ncbi:MAG TPA: hypothetical protein VF241_05025 [Propionibacteriaceae bacterium]
MSTEARESVEDIISALLEEAAVAIRWAQQYEASKRQGLRNSVPIYKARAEVALQAVKHLEEAL